MPPAEPRWQWASFLIVNVLLSCIVAYLILTHGSGLLTTKHPSSPSPSSHAISTSAWCRGTDRSDRRCRFKNLCYRRQSDEFLFVHGPESTSLGLGSRNDYIADLTSVDELNVHYFTITDLPSSALELYKVRFYDGETLFLKRFKPDNLMHVLHDDVLPLYATLRELCFDAGEACFDAFRIALMDGNPAGPLASYYSLLSGNLLYADSLANETIYCFQKAHVGINKETTWYNYGFSRPQHPIQKQPSGELIRSFARFALSRLGIRQDCQGPYAVLVSRQRDRLILNKREVMDAVSGATYWKVLHLDDQAWLDLRQALKTIACAEMLFGMHGAELILAMFTRPRTILLEMFPYAVPAKDYMPYRTLAEIPGVDLVYGAWENHVPANSRSHPNRLARWGGLRDLSAEERQRILQSPRVGPHTCCEDPEWLFRIYQDTIVDIPTLRDVVMGSLRERYHAHVLERDPEDLYPGPILSASCQLGETGYLLTWKEPWNVKYLAGSDFVRYEVWIRKVGEEDPVAVVTQDTRYIVPDAAGAQLDCWICCKIGNRTGHRKWVRCD